MTDELSITSSQAEGKANVTVFHLKGVLDAASEDALYNQACQAYDSGAKYLLLDMSDLTHISSAGLRALHNIFKKCTPEEDFEAPGKR
jgi:anti-anti-sigma factor